MKKYSSREAHFAELIRNFREVYRRNPRPRVFLQDKQYWETLAKTHGEEFTDEYEAWLCS